MPLLVAAYLAAWVPVVYAGRRIGRAWDNPEAGTWLPALLGPFGFAVFILAAHPAFQPDR